MLADDGFCVYTFTFGRTWYSGGVDPIADVYSSAAQLASSIGQVRAATGAGRSTSSATRRARFSRACI